jgi:hypothetical protein
VICEGDLDGTVEEAGRVGGAVRDNVQRGHDEAVADQAPRSADDAFVVSELDPRDRTTDAWIHLVILGRRHPA